MHMRSLVGALSLVPLFLLAGGGSSAYAEGAGAVQVKPFENHAWAPLGCGAPTAPGFMHCMAKALVDENGKMQPFAGGQGGYGPSDIQSAYNLPTTGGNGRIVAVVDAYDYASAETDLAAYRSAYGLPPCTSANGCFKRIAQDGSTNYPGTDGQGCQGWNGEEALDLDMVSAACPDCHILLVEVTDTSSQSLAAGVTAAVNAGAVAISNSYGGPEDNTVQQTESNYTQYAKGILVTASAGDQGYGASYPATSAGVIAVGGTSLTQGGGGGGRAWSETAWNQGGSGCSANIGKPSWQTQTMCAQRMEADVSAVGDPQTGVNVQCGGQMFVVGGTSASSPIVAAAFTLLNVPPQPSFVWANTADFYDVTSGSNGSCTTTSECNAGPGYDGPTGWGTPNGTLLKQTAGSSSSSGSSSGGTGSSSGVSGSSSGVTGSSSGSSSGGTGSSSGSSSSSSSGGSSNGSSGGNSSGSSPVTPDAGTGNNDNGSGNTDVGSDLSTPAAGCACNVVGTGESVGGLALGLGLVLGLTARRRRTR